MVVRSPLSLAKPLEAAALLRFRREQRCQLPVRRDERRRGGPTACCFVEEDGCRAAPLARVCAVDSEALDATISACRDLISTRFPGDTHRGAAAVLLADGSILTGTSPDVVNPATSVCHEVEPYCAAFRLDQSIRASVCLHRTPEQQFLVLSPCGVCRERLAVHGPDVLVAVADEADATVVRWTTLRSVLPHYWMTVFPEEMPAWSKAGAQSD